MEAAQRRREYDHAVARALLSAARAAAVNLEYGMMWLRVVEVRNALATAGRLWDDLAVPAWFLEMTIRERTVMVRRTLERGRNRGRIVKQEGPGDIHAKVWTYADADAASTPLPERTTEDRELVAMRLETAQLRLMHAKTTSRIITACTKDVDDLMAEGAPYLATTIINILEQEPVV